MRKTILILCAFQFLVSTVTLAQKNYNLKTGDPGIDEVLSKCEYYEYRNPKKALLLIDSALTLARNSTEIQDTIPLYFEKGYHEYMVSNYSASLKIYNECSIVFREKEKDFLAGLAQLRSAFSNARINNQEEAYKQAMNALHYFESVNDTFHVATSHSILGVVFRMQRDFEKSDEYFYKIIKLKSKSFDKPKARAYENLGINYCIKGEFNKALSYLEKYKQICLQNNDSIWLFVAYFEIGNVYLETKDIDSALYFYFQAEEIALNIEDKENLAICYNSIGICYKKNGDYNKAIKYYNKSLEISEEINYLDNLKPLYKNLANVYKRVGNTEMAYQMIRNRLKVSERLFDENLAKQIEELHTKYEVEKIEQVNADLKKDNELKDLRNKQKNIILFASIAIVIILIVLVILIYVFYRQKQANAKLKADQEIEKSKQKLIDVMKDHEIEIVETALLSQNKERKRIAKDIHDRLGVLLATIKLHFDSLNSLFSDKPKEIKKFNTVNELIDTACKDLRNIAHDIDSGNLSKFGLMHALGDLTKTIESAKKIRFDIQDFGLDKKLKNAAEIEIYRIIQELTANIIKHSNAKEVVLQFTRHENDLNILVEDDGVGFDPQKMINKGMGLKNLYSRIDKFNGSLNIDSDKGQGTTIIIDLQNVFKND